MYYIFVWGMISSGWVAGMPSVDHILAAPMEWASREINGDFVRHKTSVDVRMFAFRQSSETAL